MKRSVPIRKIRQNIYGNWRGYTGTKIFADFGTNGIAAAYWLLTGEIDFNECYSDEYITQCREIANGK